MHAADSLVARNRLEERLLVLEVVVVLLLAGCDHTYPFYFLPHSAFLEAFLLYRKLAFPRGLLTVHLGTGALDLTFQDFIRILTLVYGNKFLARDTYASLHTRTNESIIGDLAQRIKDRKKSFPVQRDVKFAHGQLLYCLRLLEDLGRNELRTLDLREYGYSSSDGDGGVLTRSNILRLCISTAPIVLSDDDDD